MGLIAGAVANVCLQVAMALWGPKDGAAAAGAAGRGSGGGGGGGGHAYAGGVPLSTGTEGMVRMGPAAVQARGLLRGWR
jgi:hypothetical protein